ncbi:MAG: Na+/H+ antiporter NhaA [Thermoleophilia bacterium]|nr:Na+/H+ antiporter NhaA [Thermoleophilia bacterium]
MRYVARPFQRFFRAAASGGILLLISVVVALGWANSRFSESYFHLWENPLTLGLGSFITEQSLHFWINDALMVIFFFAVGLEIKREFLAGELSSRKAAILPIFAAAGGMVVPAVIYLAFNLGQPGQHGWGIPMATDIAFAIGVMAVLGRRIPFGIKIFLVALAIVDDIGAVLVIALFYTGGVSWLALAAAGIIFGILIAANKMGIRAIWVYLLLGFGLWLTVHESGVHATIAGVMLAMTIPSRLDVDAGEFVRVGKNLLADFEKAGSWENDILQNSERQVALTELEAASRDLEAPLQRLERILYPWVAFVIVPVFALSNAGVKIEGDFGQLLLGDRVVLGIIAGLVLGKQIGITLFSWVAVRLNLGSLPLGVTWRHVHGASCLAGIGFTMSLFIAILAFSDVEMLDASKVGILVASLASGVLGLILLLTAPGKSQR